MSDVTITTVTVGRVLVRAVAAAPERCVSQRTPDRCLLVSMARSIAGGVRGTELEQSGVVALESVVTVEGERRCSGCGGRQVDVTCRLIDVFHWYVPDNVFTCGNRGRTGTIKSSGEWSRQVCYQRSQECCNGFYLFGVKMMFNLFMTNQIPVIPSSVFSERYIHTHTHTYIHAYVYIYTYIYIHTKDKHCINLYKCVFLHDYISFYIAMSEHILTHRGNHRAFCYDRFHVFPTNRPMVQSMSDISCKSGGSHLLTLFPMYGVQVLQAWHQQTASRRVKQQRVVMAMERRRLRLLRDGASQWLLVSDHLVQSKLARATEQQVAVRLPPSFWSP